MMSYEVIKLLIYGTFSGFMRGTRGSHTTGGASKCFALLFISLNFLNFHNIGIYILVKLLEMKSYVMCGIEWWKVKRKKKMNCVSMTMNGWLVMLSW